MFSAINQIKSLGSVASQCMIMVFLDALLFWKNMFKYLGKILPPEISYFSIIILI